MSSIVDRCDGSADYIYDGQAMVVAVSDCEIVAFSCRMTSNDCLTILNSIHPSGSRSSPALRVRSKPFAQVKTWKVCQPSTIRSIFFLWSDWIKAHTLYPSYPEWLAKSEESQVERLLNNPHGFGSLSRRHSRKPIIAAVDGLCLGGGMELVLNCDLVVATKDSVLSRPSLLIPPLDRDRVHLNLSTEYLNLEALTFDVLKRSSQSCLVYPRSARASSPHKVGFRDCYINLAERWPLNYSCSENLSALRMALNGSGSSTGVSGWFLGVKEDQSLKDDITHISCTYIRPTLTNCTWIGSTSDQKLTLGRPTDQARSTWDTKKRSWRGFGRQSTCSPQDSWTSAW